MATVHATLQRALGSSAFDTVYPKTHTDQVVNLSTLLEAITIDALNDIGDINIVTVADGDALLYDTATSKWINGVISQYSPPTGGDGTTYLDDDSNYTVPDYYTHPSTHPATELAATLTPANATELSAAVDLNTVTIAGFYYQTANADTAGNC